MLCNAHYLIKWRKERRNPRPLKVPRNPYRPRLLHCSIKNCKNNDYATGLCKNHYMQKWRKDNPKQVKTNAAKSYQKNKKKILAKDKVYRTKNRTKRNKQKRGHYAKNQERLRREKRERHKANPERDNAIARKSNKKHRAKILLKKKKEFEGYRLDVLTYYSKGTPKCKNCGITEYAFLQIDHIYGRKAMGHTRTQSIVGFYRELHKKHPKGYQVLCGNCNLMKEIRRHKTHSKHPGAVKSRYYKKLDKKQVLGHYSNGELKCVCCGFAEIDGLTIDHIEGRKKMGHDKTIHATKIYALIKRNNFPKGFQTLCMNCNHAKGRLGKCPHQK